MSAPTPHDRTTQIGVTASIAVHVVLLLLMGWWMGLGVAAKKLVNSARKALEQPKVTLLFPSQIKELPLPPPPPPAPKPKPAATAILSAPTRQYVRSNSPAPAATKSPEGAAFLSNKTTVAAASMAPAAGAQAPVPTQMQGTTIARALPVQATPPAPPAPPKPPTPPQPKPEPKSNPEPPATVLRPRLPAESATLPVVKPKVPDLKMRENPDALNPQPLPLVVKRATPVDQPPQPTPQMVEPQSLEPSAMAIPRAQPLEPMPGKSKGAVSQTGTDAVNAVESPIGKYEIQVEAAFGAQWEALRTRHAKELLPGSLRLNFFLNSKGRQEEATILENQGSQLLEKLALEAWKQTTYPPFPDALIKEGHERLEFTHHVIIIP